MSQANRPNTTSRRALLAGAPAAAAAALAVGTAVNGIAMAGASPSGGDAELLALKPQFDLLFEKWRRMHIAEKADNKDFKERMERASGMTREEAPEPCWEDPEWIAYFELMRRVRDAGKHSALLGEGAWDELIDELHPLADEIIAYKATTREGLALQARAFVCSYSELWNGGHDVGAKGFIASVCAFAGVQFPPY
jgi:hypothetical protein